MRAYNEHTMGGANKKVEGGEKPKDDKKVEGGKPYLPPPHIIDLLLQLASTKRMSNQDQCLGNCLKKTGGYMKKAFVIEMWYFGCIE